MVASALRTLGAFEMTIDGRAVARPSTQKARALLAYLALRRGAAVAREEIVEAFWPESDPDNARQSLKTALWSIRRSIRAAGFDPGEMLAGDNFTVRWLAPTVVDAAEFEERAAAGDTSAIELYAGDFLPGDYDEWSAAQRERLIDALESLLARKLEREGGVNVAQRLLAIDPFNEAAYAALIEAEVAANRAIAARTLLQRFRDLLRDNGLEPSAEFEKRFTAVEKPSRASGVPAFIGRSREQAAFERSLHLAQAAAFVVHGDAGFGKTALLERFVRRAADAGRTIVTLTASTERIGFGGWERVYRERTGRAFEDLVVERESSLGSALSQAIVATVPAGAYAFVDDAHRLSGDALFVTTAIARGLLAKGASVVVATRPEGLRAIAAALAHGAVVELPLAGLSEEEIRGSLPHREGSRETLARALYERTQGHPLFLQRILERAGTEEPAYDMPVSVRALIEERLRERGDDGFIVASLLALDLRFDGEELATILEWPQERALDAVDDLLALGIVRESSGAAHLAFAHDVVLEVARDTLSPARRKRLHRTAAAVLDRATGLHDMARAAAHRSAAGESLAAAHLYHRCAEAALAVFEPRNATAFADSGRAELAKVERTPEAGAFALQVDSALIRGLNASSEPQRAEDVASFAIAEARKLGDARALFDMVLLRMRARMRTSDVAAVEADSQTAMELAREMDDPSALAEASLGMLQSAMHRLDEEKAMRYGRLAFDAAMRSGLNDLAVFVASEYLHAQVIFWHFGVALDTLSRVDRLLEGSAVSTEPNFLYAAAQLEYLLEHYDEVERRVARGMQLLANQRAASGKFVPDRGRTLAILANIRALSAVARGDWEAAWSSAAAFAENPAAKIPAMHPHVVDLLGRVLLGRNGPGDSERVAELLESVDETTLVGDTRMYVEVARARLAARRGDPDTAVRLDRAIGLVEETAQAAGLDAHLMFADLAAAAREAQCPPQELRASELRDRSRARLEAAGGPRAGRGEARA